MITTQPDQFCNLFYYVAVLAQEPAQQMVQSKEEVWVWPTENIPDQKPAWWWVATYLNVWKVDMKSEEKKSGFHHLS